MKIQAFLLILFFFVCAFSCDKQELGENEYRIGELYIFDDELSFTIEKIDEFRCPADVICIWQGDAYVHLKIIHYGVIRDTMALWNNIHPNPLIVGPYSFQLEAVIPYPDTRKKIDEEDIIVNMVISREDTF
jgi:hypothetical protein